MTEDEFRTVIGCGHEQRGVEFKCSGASSDTRFAAKVVRAVLGMANKRDGGSVILGVDDLGASLVPTGLTPGDLATWTHDIVAGKVARYADPPVKLHAAPLVCDSRTHFVIEVEEFEEVPVLCSADCIFPSATPGGGAEEILKRGIMYVRSMASPGTTGAPTYFELRELLDLAIDKGLRQFLERAGRVGLGVQGGAAVPTDDDRFRREMSDIDG